MISLPLHYAALLFYVPAVSDECRYLGVHRAPRDMLGDCGHNKTTTHWPGSTRSHGKHILLMRSGAFALHEGAEEELISCPFADFNLRCRWSTTWSHFHRVSQATDISHSHDDLAVLLDSVTALLFNHYSLGIDSMANKGPLFLDQDPDLVNDQIMMSDDGEHTKQRRECGTVS